MTLSDALLAAIEELLIMQQLKNIFLLVTATLVGHFSHSQNWTKQKTEGKQDSIFAIYGWEEHDQFHASGAKIVLSMNGRFEYVAFRPLNHEEHAEGNYLIKKDTLILTSDFQSDNLRVEISYDKEILGDDSLYGRLLHPVNKRGDTVYNTYYFLNNDSSLNGHYDPSLSSNINPLTLKNLKVMFYDTNLGSSWLSVTQPGKFLRVRILDDVNLTDRTYKVLKDWKFKLVGSKLIELSAGN